MTHMLQAHSEVLPAAGFQRSRERVWGGGSILRSLSGPWGWRGWVSVPGKGFRSSNLGQAEQLMLGPRDSSHCSMTTAL